MRISDIRATPIGVPLEAPPRHANGCHSGRYVRTIVEVETGDGLVGHRTQLVDPKDARIAETPV
jgi:glucarate dehydratase